ncbi:MAG: hypothetical protein V4633_16975 [Pseudomonadota bacterium]
MTLAIRTFLLGCALLASLGASAGEPIPPEAEAVIDQVNAAAKAKDVKALEALMVSDRVWGAGGNASAREVLAAWSEKPGVFRQLRDVTRKRCSLREDGLIVCPNGTNVGLRAGFVSTWRGWKMAFFIAAD